MLCFLFLLPPFIRAEGFRNPPPGAFNLGRAGGRIAHVDDASAIVQNPANLVDLTASELSLSPSVVYVKVSYESPESNRARTTNPWKFLPNGFYASPWNDRIAWGVGLTTPYGLSNEWDQSGSFADPAGLRYQAPYYTELKTVNLNPAISFRLHEKLSLGAGLNLFWSELRMKQFYPWFLFPGGSGEGRARIRGDGLGIGGNVGATWKVTERQRLAATYKSPIHVHYEGSFRIDNVPSMATALGATGRGPFETRIKFPTIVALGYGVEVTDTVRIETNVEWLQFSNFKSLDMDFGNNNFLFPSTRIPQDWKDTFTAGIGGDWTFAPRWVLRGGYQFYESPVPDHTFSPAIPDANQHVFTLGIGYGTDKHHLEAAYGLDFYDRRQITSNQNPSFQGTYKMNVHLFALAYTYRF